MPEKLSKLLKVTQLKGFRDEFETQADKLESLVHYTGSDHLSIVKECREISRVRIE